MPEGDTIYRAARTLRRGLAGTVVTAFEAVLPRLSRVDEDWGVIGRTIEQVEARGKWMLMRFSGGLTLLTHMLMNGSWHIYRPGEPWKRRRGDMRIVVSTEKLLAVAFMAPIAEFHDDEGLRRRPGFNRMGPSILGDPFDASCLAARLASQPDLEIGLSLLDQSLFSGIGNVFKSEACFVSGVNPFRLVRSLSAREAIALISRARELMLANVSEALGHETYAPLRRTTGRLDRSERLWVYRRHGEPCRRCGSLIRSSKQGLEARTTFWCAVCQPMQPHPPILSE